MFWRCPICQEPLELEGGTYTCSNHHCFDRSRSGYVNLLPVNRRRSKDPGDNREMVQARQKFLEQGYYAPLVQAFCEVLSRWAAGTSAPHLILLDAGCGEGYYTAHMAAALEQCGRNVDFLGVDISKAAVERAAKRKMPSCHFAVASVFALPVADGCCQGMVNLFAPFQAHEAHRILADGGMLLLGIPGPDHLWELKRAVYDTPYHNEPKGTDLPGFRLQEQVPVRGQITLPDAESIQALFQMTPYFYRTPREGLQRMAALQHLTTTIEFLLLVYQKTGEEK